MKTFFSALFGALIWALLATTAIMTIWVEQELPSVPEGQITQESNPFLEYYTVENAVSVSPHDIRMEMDTWGTDFIIVDLRSRGEFEREHIRWAINIPGIDGDTSREEQEQRIVDAFKKLPKDKRIILHCYTHYCMLAKKVGLMLAKEGIQAQELNIWWNEWRNEWDLWNGEGTADTIDISKYIEGTNVESSVTEIPQTGWLITPCTAEWLAGC